MCVWTVVGGPRGPGRAPLTGVLVHPRGGTGSGPHRPLRWPRSSGPELASRAPLKGGGPRQPPPACSLTAVGQRRPRPAPPCASPGQATGPSRVCHLSRDLRVTQQATLPQDQQGPCGASVRAALDLCAARRPVWSLPENRCRTARSPLPEVSSDAGDSHRKLARAPRRWQRCQREVGLCLGRRAAGPRRVCSRRGYAAQLSSADPVRELRALSTGGRRHSGGTSGVWLPCVSVRPPWGEAPVQRFRGDRTAQGVRSLPTVTTDTFVSSAVPAVSLPLPKGLTRQRFRNGERFTCTRCACHSRAAGGSFTVTN